MIQPESPKQIRPLELGQPLGLALMGKSSPSFAEAKAAKEYWQAKLARLKYEEESGQVVSKDQVSSKAFDAGRIARDNLLSIPARLMDVLAVETDPRQIHSLLEEDIRKVLDELIRSLKQ